MSNVRAKTASCTYAMSKYLIMNMKNNHFYVLGTDLFTNTMTSPKII